MNRTIPIAASVAALALAVPALAAAAPAPASYKTAKIADGLVSPLSMGTNNPVAAYVSQNFAGSLVKVKRGEEPKVLFTGEEGQEVGAVDVRGRTIIFAISTGENEGGVVHRLRRGTVTTLGDTGAAEELHNPDGTNTYGFADITEECAEQFPEEEFGPAKYDGIVETHPYATAISGRTVYVADAGANAIWRIADGQVTPVAALLPVEVVVTAEQAEAFGMPECVAGLAYGFEPVPTDLEVGRDGQLYVTSLPGGPEDPSLGANGAVLRIDPATGEVTKLAEGFSSAAGLAVAPNGDIYVSELFPGRIMKVPAGSSTPELFREAAMPAALEVRGRFVLATTNVLSGMDEGGGMPDGRVMRFKR